MHSRMRYAPALFFPIYSSGFNKNAFFESDVLRYMVFSGIENLKSNSLMNNWVLSDQKRFMTAGRRVQDRSKKKRVHDLEKATEKWKVLSKVLFVMEVLKREPEQIITFRGLEKYRRQINLPKPHKISDFLRKSPKLFELYKDKKGVIWCGLTYKAEELLEEEERLQREHSEKMVEYVTRFLMMSVDKRLCIDKIAHFRRDIGLPDDFRKRWIHMFPEYFRVITIDDIEYLELVSWRPEWAVTELEKRAWKEAELKERETVSMGKGGLENKTVTPAKVGLENETVSLVNVGAEREPVSSATSETVSLERGHGMPGWLSLPFPLKFPPNYKKIYRYGGSIEHFQELTYLSPYADARELKPGSLEFDKRAVAVMHELLGFTTEKRLVIDHLTHFRHEFKMPQKLMRLLLKHCGIFYVSERGKRLSAFLTEAYEGMELIVKCPLVLWKEKVMELVGYRGKNRKGAVYFNEISEDERDGLFSHVNDSENALKEFGDEGGSEDASLDLRLDDSDMDLGEIERAYNDQ
ncbi:protein ROOT PRIMORDIUM DEFECTIVE 1 isoform X1 [Amborella trichopoda]|nr:protein ROOT PRIMORDIUM DEFECTIVE 1 isoform X1 [Amborella trichopoda]XP_020522354.1 protein ROOT PRIMORDIUM DEFECTIVE 1 isoform X1 [Amborella trichopoda]XP_020522355.1 protein ROOT PRIMORDIUM DEFECTIVE 1 isoform X1 [Amborella trichopoda]XP_020522356.1 protein ROOT PRIMORDIUM DEFECTIVE 1 isoform X1 [Amborella trichopoda]|eukprot:XP_020522353.1 protein ROOT PRIMORDIUM DEFECTIVE 1 isoform X1 [Amborella trichopoda]